MSVQSRSLRGGRGLGRGRGNLSIIAETNQRHF